MRIHTNLTGLAAAVVLCGAVPALAQQMPEGSQVVIPEPPAGMGQIVFFRPGSMMGMAMGCQVNEGVGTPDETKLSSLGSGKYFVLQTTPGTHEFWVRNERTDALTLLVEPDETQFVRCRIKMGLISGRPDIVPEDAATFVAASDDLELVDDDDMLAVGVLRAAQMGPAAQ